MPEILNAQFPEADYNHSSGSKSSVERIDSEMELRDAYVPRAKIILADKPSEDKDQDLAYFRCKVLYESFDDLKLAYLQIEKSAYKPFKVQNELMGSSTSLLVSINFEGQPCEL